MKTLLTLAVALLLSGCAMHKIMPSFWDDNQSAKIIDLRLSVERLDCDQPHLAQAQQIKDNLDWFVLYSQSKGQSQGDVLALVAPMQATVDDFYKRSQGTQGSKVYCELKKKILREQAQRAAGSVLGRW